MVINKGKEGIYIDGDKVDYFHLFERHLEISRNGKKQKICYPNKVFINGFQRVDKTRIINHNERDNKFYGSKVLNYV